MSDGYEYTYEYVTDDSIESIKKPKSPKKPSKKMPELKMDIKPIIKKPITEKPITEKPITEKPITEKPITKKPVSEKKISPPVRTKKEIVISNDNVEMTQNPAYTKSQAEKHIENKKNVLTPAPSPLPPIMPKKAVTEIAVNTDPIESLIDPPSKVSEIPPLIKETPSQQQETHTQSPDIAHDGGSYDNDYYDYYDSYDEYYYSNDVDFEKLTHDLLSANYNLETLKNIYSECVKQRSLSEMTKEQKDFLDRVYCEIEKKKKNKNN